ncbi:MAG: tyrosine-type recombinase/integrase [Rhodobacteraceae bacterium]|nr:tyrosine-type recombinase/integrase [Paracoccaceae bacterium]MCY4140360.1 tyrosine-type recombinase/integrase [Paracoccaceae bacterium]
MTIIRKTGALGVAKSATVAVGIVPAAFASAGENGRRAWLDFFAAQIRNRNTRQAYARAAHRLFDWLSEYGIHDVVDIEPVHIAVWLEERMREASRPTVKQELAGIRRLFDWLTVRQVVSSSPAAAVRGPKHTVRRGTTPVLSAAECRRFLRSIPVETIGGLRDRAFIATMTYSFARVSAALAMNVKDVFFTDGRLWLRLLEKGGKVLEVPCHHNLETYLQDYIEAAGIASDRDGPLFRSLNRDGSLSGRRLTRQRAWEMLRRRARVAGISTDVCNHSFRATGITAYLENPEARVEVAQYLAGHADPKTTKLYDRRADRVSLDEIERIGI